MIAYLDSSALVAWFDPHSPHHRRVTAWREDAAGAQFAFNRLLQLECGHYFRRNRGEYAAAARQAFAQAEAARRFHFDATSPVELMPQAETLSRQHGSELGCGFWDLCHVAAAARAGWLFVTADRQQAAAAELAGVDTVFVGPKP